MLGFRRLPSWWLRDDLALKRFKGGRDGGNSIAALKILLAIVVTCEVSSLTARISYNELMRITGLSRPMLPRGIRLLEECKLVAVNREARSSAYQLVSLSSDVGWSKVPCYKVQETLVRLPNKGEAGLAALKIYIYLLSIRDNPSKHVFASYEKIRAATGLQQKWVRPGLDLLFSHLFIHIQRVEELDKLLGIDKPKNKYTILGDLRLTG